MDILILATLVVIAFGVLKAHDQRRRVVLLGSQLRQYQIEKLMENLTEGYLRGLGEQDADRRAQIWGLLAGTEEALNGQFQRFVVDFAKLDAADTRVSTLPFAVPFADKLFPSATFDLRQAFAIHARGMAEVAQNQQQRSPRDKAFTMSAELFLMQHSCHWFCRSRAVASARLLARHKTSYAQVLDAVSPGTRQAYSSLVGR
ncbi:hypothetical protein AAFF27_05600 [Xylophilus sp. GW821-FHT01B05]